MAIEERSDRLRSESVRARQVCEGSLRAGDGDLTMTPTSAPWRS